ncbi:MAG: hypothetical protein ACI4W2_12635 [Eubacterium sp.]
MKSIQEIKNIKTLKIEYETPDGGAGYIKIPASNKKGYKKASVIWSNGMGWEHVSVSICTGGIPTWNDMCWLKDQFFHEDEAVVQFHPRKSKYVNIKENCLHLWRPTIVDLPEPPVICV